MAGSIMPGSHHNLPDALQSGIRDEIIQRAPREIERQGLVRAEDPGGKLPLQIDNPHAVAPHPDQSYVQPHAIGTLTEPVVPIHAIGVGRYSPVRRSRYVVSVTAKPTHISTASPRKDRREECRQTKIRDASLADCARAP